MKNSNRFYRTAFASVMLMGLCIFLVNSVYAQCPTDVAPAVGTTYWGGTIPAWTPGSTTITIGGCVITVNYCYRDIGDWPVLGTNTRQLVISSFSDNGDPSCASIDVEVNIIVNQTLTQITGNPPPCGDTPLHGQTFRHACWKRSSGGMLIGCDNGAYCIMDFDMCYSFGQVHTSNVTTSVQGDASECGAEPSPWTPGDPNCYLITCGSH